MKKQKRLLLLSAVALLLIAICAVTVIALGGNESTPIQLSIYGKNLSLEDSVCIVYAVPVEGTGGADIRLLVWMESQPEYTYGTQTFVLTPEENTVEVEGEECYIFYLRELAAKQMTVDVYARAYACVTEESDTQEYYSALDKYSVLQYCYNMLGKTSSNVPSEEMEALIHSMLEYGASAQIFFGENVERLANADYYQIRLINAGLSDGTDHGLYLEGTELQITAPSVNEAGDSFRYWKNSAGVQVSKNAAYTVTVGRLNETYTAVYCNHETEIEEVIAPAIAPTCLRSGRTQGSYCASCGEFILAPTVLPATGIHTYEGSACKGCGQSLIPLTAVPSVYDANGDGKTDVYYFSTQLTDRFDNAIHLNAGSYDRTLSTEVSTYTASGIQHWYVTTDQSIVYRVTVPEDGLYEMAIHLRLKDASERGTKYTVNGGTAYEQVFETSYGFTGTEYENVRDSSTLTTYMYGITVSLKQGENIIKIEQSSALTKNQHYRDFYFVKIGDFHLHAYDNEAVTQEATCKENGELTHFCTCGLSKREVIPATGEHDYVEGVCTGCGNEYVEPGIVSYSFLYDTPGFAGGSVEFHPAQTDTYTFYWGDANGKLADYTMLYSDTFYGDMTAEVTIQSFTAIPKGATKLLAVGAQGVTYSYDIPESHWFGAEELYSFGAISDSHQGNRYGDTSIPYNHFVNAAKILSDKGVSLIGICGDISYENEEFEYVLHSDAIKEIYEYDPKMPIYTVSGNHESKYTGFSKEWFLKYSRNVVDYDTSLLPIFSDGNDLDFVIELPDGSVMIYLNQIYYDYNNATSRLLDDYQLDWLGARLEQYRDRTVFLFFHTFLDEEAGDASTVNGKEYSLPLISGTVDHTRLTQYLTQYKNVVYFSGHSHQSFDLQFMEEKAGDKSNLYTNIDNNNGTFATMVHIPSVAAPRVGLSLSDAKTRSEGYIVHVYEDCVVFEGYDFVGEQTFAYATYIISK